MLSGLRSVIYVLLPINEKLKSISPPWSISLPAQIAAVMAPERK
jgi:histidinol-phosphate/aromatic aminotransferase/cobyric acid decarboxylase-like protein